MADPQALDTTQRINPYLQQGPVEWELPKGDATPDARPGALQTGAPPGITPGVTTQQAQAPGQQVQPPAQQVDPDEDLYRQAETIEEDTYAKNLLDASGRKPLLGPIDRHSEQDKLDQAKELYGQITDMKLRKSFEPRIRALERKIQSDMTAQERRVRQERTDQLNQIDAPRTTPKALADIGAIMQNEIDTLASSYEGNRTSRNRTTARQADFDVVTSPLSTLSEVGPDGKVKGYGPLRNVATSVSSLNRLPSNDLAVQYALQIGSPVGTDEKGNQLPGMNGVKGKGATNYKVLGRDARDNYLLEMGDRRVLRVDPTTMSTLRQARLKGYAAGQKWEKDQIEKNKPGPLTRVIQALVPEKGF